MHQCIYRQLFHNYLLPSILSPRPNGSTFNNDNYDLEYSLISVHLGSIDSYSIFIAQCANDPFPGLMDLRLQI